MAGNIRELQNTIERIDELRPDQHVTVHLIRSRSAGSESGRFNSPADFERPYDQHMLNLNLSEK